MLLPIAILGLAAWCALAWSLRRRRERRPGLVAAEVAALALVQAAGFWAARPYLVPTIVGAGDAFHYTLQVADAVTQHRDNGGPVMVGQSMYAFNGGVHTLRTAPYFTHAGILLDGLTGRRLTFPALSNLVIVLSIFAGGLSGYFAARRLLPGHAIAPALLATAWVLSPAYLVPLYHYDLFATVLTMPWQPLFWMGVVQSLEAGMARGKGEGASGRREGLFWAVFALAVIWYAHAPTAIWLSGAFAIAQVPRFWGRYREGITLRDVGLLTLAATLLLAYLAYSVKSLGLSYSLAKSGTMPTAIMNNLRAAFPGSLNPLARAAGPYFDLQLGYTLWIALVLGIAVALKRREAAGVVLAIAAAGCLVLLLPIPGVTGALWKAMPPKVLDLTNDWPMQRIYPVLAGLATALGALAMRTSRASPLQMRGRIVVVVALAAGCAWSASEARVIRQRTAKTLNSEAVTERMLSRASLNPGRSSYLLFGWYPPYFSHARMDPEFELRLLGPGGERLVDNSAWITAGKRGGPAPEWQPLDGGAKYQADGSQDLLAEYSFAGTSPGVVVVSGPSLQYASEVPTYGERFGFGSNPDSAHAVALRVRGAAPQELNATATVPGTRIRFWPFVDTDLPLQLEKQAPLTIRGGGATPAGVLETPRVFIPGYTGRVDGVETPVVRSQFGLAAVAVPAGFREAVIMYPGPRGLRMAYYVSLVAGLGWLIAGISFATRGRPGVASGAPT